jgi:FMN-dependent NADH-azoreductase
MKLLHIDSSILGIRSVSRALSAQIVEREKTIHPDLTVVYRDLASDAALHLSNTASAANPRHFFLPAKKSSLLRRVATSTRPTRR